MRFFLKKSVAVGPIENGCNFPGRTERTENGRIAFGMNGFHEHDVVEYGNLVLGRGILFDGGNPVFTLQRIQKRQPGKNFVVKCLFFFRKLAPILNVVRRYHAGVQPKLAGQFLESQFVHHVFNVVPVNGFEWNFFLVCRFV